MRQLSRLGVLAVLVLLVACGGTNPRSPDGSVDSGGGTDGSGGCPGCPNGEPSRPVLRANIGLDLARVGSFFALSRPNSQALGLSATRPMMTAQALDGGDQDGAASDGSVPATPGLYALTLSGDTLEVSLVEEGNPKAVGQVIMQPEIVGIWPTAKWVLFNAQLLVVNKLDADGGSEQIPCSTIAARRSDGALFCAPLLIGHGDGAVDDRFPLVQSNAAGDVAFATAGVVAGPNQPPASSSFHVYRIALGSDGGPTATLAVDASIRANWFLADAAGDLLVNYFPAPLNTSQSASKIFPADSGTPFVVSGSHHSFAACGSPGAADENTFYLLNGGGGGWPFDGTIAIVTQGGGSFAEALQPIGLPDANTYGGLYRIGDDLYMFSKFAGAVARVVSGGAVVASPTPVVLAGVDQFIDFNGMPIRQVQGGVVLLGSLGGVYRFLRYDGVAETTIPLAASIQPARVIVSSTGAIDFWGLDIATQENIQGSVPAGQTTVTITKTGVLDQTQVVAFTRIN